MTIYIYTLQNFHISIIIVPKQFKGSNRGQKSRKKSTAGGSGDRRRGAAKCGRRGPKRAVAAVACVLGSTF